MSPAGVVIYLRVLAKKAYFTTYKLQMENANPMDMDISAARRSRPRTVPARRRVLDHLSSTSFLGPASN